MVAFIRRARPPLFLLTTALACAPAAARADESVTFSKDVAPILFAQCASCHRPGGAGPFSVLSFADVRPHAKAIASAVRRRSMPPWMPEPGHGDFVGSRRLTDRQIAVVEKWAEAGAPLGDPNAMPPVPETANGWQLGPPDLILKIAAPYRLAPGGRDRLRNFVIPIPTSVRRYVRAWEFHIPNQRVVHHATVMVDPMRASRELDEKDPEPGYEGLIALSARNPDGYFLGWTPSQSPATVPEGMAWPLDANSDLVLMLHLRPTEEWETVDASVGLYFTDRPPTRAPSMIRLNRQDLDIVPGDGHYVATDSFVTPVDVDAYTVQPHAHNLATQVKAWATLPDGSQKWLVDIERWNFHWQDTYRYAVPVRLPAGTTLSMEFVFDNSAANAVNPVRPPARVLWGQQTTDEMADVWVQVLSTNDRDSAVLNESLRRSVLPQNIAGYLSMLKADKDNVSLHDDLAILYSQAGERRRAAEQFAESLRLRPTPASQYNLANALLLDGRAEEAAGHFESALQLKPEYALAHQGLALVLAARGARAAAIAHLKEAVRLAPSLEDAHYNLGVLLAADAQPTMAAASLKEALALRRDWPAAEASLAWLLSTSSDAAVRDPAQAVSLAERAVASTGSRDARALDVLAASLAAAGRFDEAISAEEKALGILNGSGSPTNAVKRRLDLYRNGIAYIDRP